MKILEAFGMMFIITTVSIISIIGACIGACVGAVIFPLNILGGRADFTEIKTHLSSKIDPDKDQI